MEGITGYIYRNAYHAFFEGADKYFTPFLAPDQNRTFKTREREDILPEHNRSMPIVPQILTNRAGDFIRAAMELWELGYPEVNLNLGCPSGTVVSKGRGSGFLARTEELDSFFETVFSHELFSGSHGSKMKCSVKTRIGKDSPEEFYELIEIFNKYPIAELTIHPRTQKDYYKKEPRLTIFEDAEKLSKNPLCYNGNIYTLADYEHFVKRFPQTNAVMLGRGLISNPALIGILKGKPVPKKQKWKEFHDKLYHDYQQVLPGDTPVLFKMKEVWLYMVTMFTNAERFAKKIKKAKNLKDYEAAVERMFQETELADSSVIKGESGMQQSPKEVQQ
jgi:tRNA-dihydrouridine synthase